MGRILFVVFIVLVVAFMVLVAAKLLDISGYKSDEEIQKDFMDEIYGMGSIRKEK